MKRSFCFLLSLVIIVSCTSNKKLAYLGGIQADSNESKYEIKYPDYRIQKRDVLYITMKAMTPDGSIRDFLASTNEFTQTIGAGQGESGSFLFGYDVDPYGEITLPVLGKLRVIDLTIDEARKLLQTKSEQVFQGATVECKLLSFKFTVIGEVFAPGTYNNYNNYLTVLEAIGRAGGINDYGKRDKIMVVRSNSDGIRTFNINLHDKSILSSEAYFLLPNDVVIIEPETRKIFNLNLPTISFILTSVTSAITTTILLINYLK